MTEQALLNRIHKLEARQRKNGRIVRKLYRKLRALQAREASNPTIEV